MEGTHNLGKLTWEEVEDLLEKPNVVLVPVGSTEQHGPALPLDNDYYIATEIAKRAAEQLSGGIETVITPTISFGYSPHHMEFKGTITLRESTLVEILVDVCDSLFSHGFHNIVIINGHGGNSNAINSALQLLFHRHGIRAYAIDWWTFAADKISELVTRPVFHACDMETSVAWYLGQRVLADRRVDEPGKKPIPGFIEPDMLSSPPKVTSAFMMKEFTDTGAVGLGTKATKEKGEEIVGTVIERIVEFIIKLLEQ